MKTDRELLELAAKAAGKNLTDWRWIESPIPGYWWCPHGEPTARTWNPLIDDGDALRLAVTLRITVGPESPDVIGQSLCRASWNERTMSLGEYGRGDPFAATRRAITRASAAIGESMQ